jgi:hypothetical protein
MNQKLTTAKKRICSLFCVFYSLPTPMMGDVSTILRRPQVDGWWKEVEEIELLPGRIGLTDEARTEKEGRVSRLIFGVDPSASTMDCRKHPPLGSICKVLVPAHSSP